MSLTDFVPNVLLAQVAPNYALMKRLEKGDASRVEALGVRAQEIGHVLLRVILIVATTAAIAFATMYIPSAAALAGAYIPFVASTATQLGSAFAAAGTHIPLLATAGANLTSCSLLTVGVSVGATLGLHTHVPAILRHSYGILSPSYAMRNAGHHEMRNVWRRAHDFQIFAATACTTALAGLACVWARQ